MPSTPTAAGPIAGRTPAPEPEVDDEEMVEDELLIEEISIDGMCGVY